MSDFNWNTFDPNRATEESPAMSFEPVPVGWYPTIINSTEWKKTNGASGPGEMLVLACEIIDGQYKAKKCWENLNLKNSNQDTVRIARGSLGRLTLSIGLTHPKNESELCRKPVLAYWGLSKPSKDFPPKNEIKDWKPIDEQTPDMFEPPVSTPGGVGAPAPSPNKKPWEK